MTQYTRNKSSRQVGSLLCCHPLADSAPSLPGVCSSPLRVPPCWCSCLSPSINFACQRLPDPLPQAVTPQLYDIVSRALDDCEGGVPRDLAGVLEELQRILEADAANSDAECTTPGK